DDMDDMGDDMADDDMDDMADDMDDDMMPATGVNTSLLAIVALAVVLAGAMVLGLSRRLRTQ
ncbi:MAG: LPXTG cell wall anchor domain-containing protein, partial [bacterium]|nr:LPXTG cell wall anchor domain-containing protein [bacterium]